MIILYTLTPTFLLLLLLALALSKDELSDIESGLPLALGAVVLHIITWYLALYFILPSTSGPLASNSYYFVALCFEIFCMSAILRQRLVGVASAALLLWIFLSSIPILHSARYAGLVGSLERRIWTTDVQPTSTAHIRLITPEVAMQVAQQQLSAGGGSIGSQFEIHERAIHNQNVNGRMWWVVPLEFRSFTSWTATDGTPGFIMVSAEDPNAEPRFIQSTKLRYTPGAFFSNNLERHVWQSGFRTYVIQTPVLEVDDSLHPWWVIPLADRTVGLGGMVVRRVLVVNPENGAIQDFPLSQVPSWVDRAIPEEIVRDNLLYNGLYAGGIWNRLWTGHNLTQPAGSESIFQYASDGQPYWVTQITSNNDNDTTMLRLVYTNARTNRSRVYQVRGGTEQAILQRLNNAVSYQRLHAANPVFYNIRGHMTAIAPIIGESHTYQRVGLVSLTDLNLAPAIAPDIATALRLYEQLLSRGPSSGIPSENRSIQSASSTVERLGMLSAGQEVTYIFTLANRRERFTVSTNLAPEAALLRSGDSVTVGFTPNDEGLVVVTRFVNTTMSR